MCLQLAVPDDRTAGVQDGVAGPGLGGAWVVTIVRAMSVSIEVEIGVHLEALAALGV